MFVSRTLAVLFMATCIVGCRNTLSATDAPAIASLSPTSGPNGAQVTIRGANFTSKNTITLSSGDRSFALDSPASSPTGTSLQFRVSSCPSYEPQCPGVSIPAGAYELTVTNDNGTSNRMAFTVTAQQ